MRKLCLLLIIIGACVGVSAHEAAALVGLIVAAIGAVVLAAELVADAVDAKERRNLDRIEDPSRFRR